MARRVLFWLGVWLTVHGASLFAGEPRMKGGRGTNNNKKRKTPLKLSVYVVEDKFDKFCLARSCLILIHKPWFERACN